MKLYSYIGLVILVLSEVLLFLGVRPVAIFFTPLVWTGYILLVDGIVLRVKGSSLIVNHQREFFLMIPLSAAFWYLFEFFNLFIKNWGYEGLPQFWITAIGMTWAFGTIGPAIIETENLVSSLRFFRTITRQRVIFRPILYFLVTLGGLGLALILLTPPWVVCHLGILLWLGFFLIFDPINYLRGNRSLLRENGTLWSLLISGILCGFLWEFWNYWAEARWVYTLPYYFGPRIFEMPLLGYLGFPLLALEYFAFYSLFLNWHQGGKNADNHR